MDLQHGGGLRPAHAVLQRAGVHPFILLFHVEQPQDVAVVDLEPGGGQRREAVSAAGNEATTLALKLLIMNLIK